MMNDWVTETDLDEAIEVKAKREVIGKQFEDTYHPKPCASGLCFMVLSAHSPFLDGESGT